MAQSIEVEISANYNADDVNRKLANTERKIEDLAEALDSLGPKLKGEATKKIFIQVEGRDATKGTLKAVEDQFGGLETGTRKLAKSLNSLNGVERSLNATEASSRGYQRQQQYIEALNNALNKAQGIEQGSIAQKRQLLAVLQRQSDALRQGSEEQRRYAREVKKLSREISNTNGPLSAFFNALNRLASIQAGFTAFGAILGSFSGSINQLINQQKQIEGFELALKNIGLSTAETGQAFAEAGAIADRLGAPIQQVEKSFKRMVPALRAVGVNAKDTSGFIEGVAARSQTLGLNTEQSGRYLEAFAQVLSKGKLQAEELNQQISELDGAFRTQLADSLNVTTKELEEMIKNGEVTAKVFVKAFKDMENGAEELAKRVQEGNMTVQQLQNQISNLQTRNLRAIGKALEPAIKAFFQIQLAVEKFIKTVVESEFGGFLAEVFNNTVLALRDVITGFLNAAKAVGFFLEPLFAVLKAITPLIRIIVPLAAGFYTLKAATLAYAASVAFTNTTLIPFIAKLAATVYQAMLAKAALIKLTAVNLASNIAGWVTASFEFIKTLIATRGSLAAASTELKVYTALQGKASAGALASVAKFAAAAGVIAYIAVAFNDFQDGAKKGRESVKELEAGIKEMEMILEKNGNQTKRNIDLLTQLKNLIPGLSLFSGMGQSKEVQDRLIKPLEQGVKTTKRLINDFKEEFPALVGAGDESLKSMRQSIKITTEQMEAFLKNADQLHADALAEGNHYLAVTITEVAVAIHEALGPMKEELGLIEEEIDKRKSLREEIKNAITSLDEYNNKRKEAEEFQDKAALALEINLLKEYGDSAKDAADKTLALSAAEAFRHEGNIKRLNAQLELIKKKDAEEFGGEEEKQKLIDQITKDILSDQKKQMEAAKQFADTITAEVERVFKESSDASQNYLDIANQVASAVDGVRSSITSTLGTLRSASDIVFDNMLPGASPQQQLEVERARVMFAARMNNLEHKIAQIKLQTSFRMQQIETQTMQARLRGEAQLARTRGDEAGAQNLERSANALTEVLKLNEMNYNIERQNLDLQKRIKDEQLVQQAMSTKIGGQEMQLFSNNRNRTIAIEETNAALGTQSLTLDEIEKTFNGLSSQTNQLELFDQKALQSGQNALNMQLGSFEDINARVKEMQTNFSNAVETNQGLFAGLGQTIEAMSGLTAQGKAYNQELEKALGNIGQIKSSISSGTAARWMGGPVEGGQTYRVNDAGLGREAFMNKFGNISMLPAGSNINWTAPSSGTIIPAGIVKQLSKNAEYNTRIANSNAKTVPSRSTALDRNVGANSGNLVKQMTAALSGSGGNQRITNNVTIQSQQPVTDASQIMTNVARMRLRNSRRI